MRFKNVDGQVGFFLSNREVSNYDKTGRLGLLNEGNRIEDGGLNSKLQNGTFSIKINGHQVNLQVDSIKTGEYGWLTKASANGIPIEMIKTSPPTKHNLYRLVVGDLEVVVPENTSVERD